MMTEIPARFLPPISHYDISNLQQVGSVVELVADFLFKSVESRQKILQLLLGFGLRQKRRRGLW